MSGGTILVVEDDMLQREAMDLLLRHEGYAVLTAADARETLDLLRGHPAPDLIVLDMLIAPPGAVGWQLLKRRKQVPALAAVPIVITTSLAAASREWASSLGTASLVRKPFEAEPLLMEIRNCLGETGRG